MTAQRYCGVSREAGTGDAILIAESDGLDAIESTWAKLWDAFEADDSILLAHFWNHYALIYAMRSWTGADGGVHREFLTAKPAQRRAASHSTAILRGYLGGSSKSCCYQSRASI